MRYCLVALLLICTLGSSAQVTGNGFAERLSFVNHLTNNEFYNEAVFELERLKAETFGPQQLDSIHYLLGWNLHMNEQLRESSGYFSKVSTTAPFYLKSAFLGGMNYAYLGEHQLAREQWASVASEDLKIKRLVAFEQAGLSLLNEDFAAFDSLQQDFTGAHYAFASEEEKLRSYRKKLGAVKRKSPLLAGAMSAIVPGTGKMYAGRMYQGLFSFVFVGVLAGATYEQYRHGGLSNPQFYLVGSLFSIFYVGNIYGSVYSVKVKRTEQYEALKTEVLFNMHVPLRTIF